MAGMPGMPDSTILNIATEEITFRNENFIGVSAIFVARARIDDIGRYSHIRRDEASCDFRFRDFSFHCRVRLSLTSFAGICFQIEGFNPTNACGSRG
jgi:hypothetical protein